MDAVSPAGDGLLFVRGPAARGHRRGCASGRDAAVAIVNPGNGFRPRRQPRGARRPRREGEGAECGVTSSMFRSTSPPTPGALPRRRRRSGRVLGGVAVAPPAAGRRAYKRCRWCAGAGRAGRAGQARRTNLPDCVRWADCLEACVEGGATAFLELGPRAGAERDGDGLEGAIGARCLEQFRTLEGARAWLRQQAAGASAV